MKNYLPRLKQFFSNKKVIIVLLILAVSTVIFEVKQIFFTNHQPKVVYYTPWVPEHQSNPPENIPTPILTETSGEFSVIEENNEYLVSNIYDAYFDKSGNIFYVKRIESITNNPDEDEYKLVKYNIDAKVTKEVVDNIVVNKINISKNGEVIKDNNIFYKIENGVVNYIEKIDCKYFCERYTRADSLIITKSNNKILVSINGEGITGWHTFYKKNENNDYIEYLKTDDGYGNNVTNGYFYIGVSQEQNAIILGKINGRGPDDIQYDKAIVYISEISLKDNDTGQEKEIYKLNPKEGITDSYVFQNNNQAYLSIIINNKKLVVINLNNNEKIIEKSFENDEIEMLFIQRNIDDKVMLNVVTKEYNRPKNNYKCFNLATKDYVSLDACGDPEKIYLGNWKGKSIYQINYQYQ